MQELFQEHIESEEMRKEEKYKYEATRKQFSKNNNEHFLSCTDGFSLFLFLSVKHMQIPLHIPLEALSCQNQAWNSYI